MTVADQLSRFGPYLGRLLEDEYIQEQIGEAVTGLRRSARRVSDRSASEALNDQRLRTQLRDAFNALIAVARSLQDKPVEPERHLAKRALLLAAAGGAAAMAWRARSANNNQADYRGGNDG